MTDSKPIAPKPAPAQSTPKPRPGWGQTTIKRGGPKPQATPPVVKPKP
jgi:hypothetical protein